MLAECPHQFGSTDRLADVPLGVLGNVCQQADDRGGQPFSPDFTRVAENGWVESPDNFLGSPDSVVQPRQQLIPRRARFRLRFEGGELRFRQLLSFQIGHEPIDAPRDMAHVKSDRTQAVRPRPDLFARQAFGIAGKILTSLLKGEKYGRRERIDAGEAPQPRLGKLADRLDLSKSEEDFQSELQNSRIVGRRDRSKG